MNTRKYQSFTFIVDDECDICICTFIAYFFRNDEIKKIRIPIPTSQSWSQSQKYLIAIQEK